MLRAVVKWFYCTTVTVTYVRTIHTRHEAFTANESYKILSTISHVNVELKTNVLETVSNRMRGFYSNDNPTCPFSHLDQQAAKCAAFCQLIYELPVLTGFIQGHIFLC
jgi:hypothetical protein